MITASDFPLFIDNIRLAACKHRTKTVCNFSNEVEGIIEKLSFHYVLVLESKRQIMMVHAVEILSPFTVELHAT